MPTRKKRRRDREPSKRAPARSRASSRPQAIGIGKDHQAEDPKTLNLALQGGGQPWRLHLGVLDRLLERSVSTSRGSAAPAPGR